MRAIHSHLFSRVYSRAGKVRTVETSKGGHQFMFRKYIGNGMADVHRRILAANYFIGANVADFAEGVGRIIGDGNYVHPFREGNERTELLYLRQLRAVAGQRLVLPRIDRDAWLETSKRVHPADYAPMSQVIPSALEPSEGSADSKDEAWSPAGNFPRVDPLGL